MRHLMSSPGLCITYTHIPAHMVDHTLYTHVSCVGSWPTNRITSNIHMQCLHCAEINVLRRIFSLRASFLEMSLFSVHLPSGDMIWMSHLWMSTLHCILTRSKFLHYHPLHETSLMNRKNCTKQGVKRYRFRKPFHHYVPSGE